MRGSLLLLAALAAGCVGETPAGSVAEIQDSAGVRVIVNPAPDTTAAFRLSDEPLAVIGLVEGAPEYQLFRVTSGTRLSDGTIVLMNGGTQELRFYDAAGTHLRTAGRAGEGPGEFGESARLVGAFAADSLMISDGRLSRFSVFTAGGEFVRSYPAASELGFAWETQGMAGSGRVLVAPLPLPDLQSPPGVERRTRSLLWVEPDGTVSPFGEFPGEEISRTRSATAGVVFGRGLEIEARGGRIAVGNTDAYSVRMYGPTGEPVQVVRQVRDPVPVQPGDFERALPEPFRPGAPPGQSRMAQNIRPAIEQMPRLTTLPAFMDVRLDGAGTLWVADYRVGWLATPLVWSAFAPDGTYLGRLDVPDRFTVLDIGTDWILARTVDELDVERVVLYGLERPASP